MVSCLLVLLVLLLLEGAGLAGGVSIQLPVEDDDVAPDDGVGDIFCSLLTLGEVDFLSLSVGIMFFGGLVDNTNGCRCDEACEVFETGGTGDVFFGDGFLSMLCGEGGEGG